MCIVINCNPNNQYPADVDYGRALTAASPLKMIAQIRDKYRVFARENRVRSGYQHLWTIFPILKNSVTSIISYSKISPDIVNTVVIFLKKPNHT